MKKILVTTLFFSFWLSVAISHAGWVTMFGPNKYVRSKGAPDIYTDTFSALSGEGFLRIWNGDRDGKHRLSSAKVFINGEQIFGPSDFNQQIYLFENPIDLSETNAIKVETRSKPGSYLTIDVVQYIEPPTLTINANPLTIRTGESSMLTWTSANADSVSIDQGIGPVATNGSISVSPSETVIYTITAENLGGTTTAFASVTFLNTPPVANPQSVETDEDTPLQIILSGFDIDNDPLTYQVVSSPIRGMISGTPPDLTYSPAPDYNGQDAFEYEVNDGVNNSPTATINIMVNSVNDPPTAVDDAFPADENQPITLDSVLANDTDIDGDDLTISGFTQPDNGTVSSHGDGSFTYISHPGFSGMDSFSYTVSDGHGGSDAGTVMIEVIPGTLEVTITNPVEGTRLISDNIIVTGSVSSNSASVSVNGISATVDGKIFTAENVPLVPGVNTISVLAENGPHTAVTGITVTLLTEIDLEPIQIEIISISEESGLLKISGEAAITVANNGSSSVTEAYSILLFEDVNVNGSFEETEDNTLGKTRIPEGPGPGEAMNTSIEFIGERLFRDNRMHVFLDSDSDIEESDEGNNIVNALYIAVI